MTTITCPLHTAARRFGDAIAIEGQGHRLSYIELDGRISALCEHLSAQGVKASHHVGYIGANRLEAIELLYAAMRLGAVFVPLSPRFVPEQQQALIRSLDLQWLWQEGDLACAAKPLDLSPGYTEALWRFDASRGVSLILTSGSSGQPKAAMHNTLNHLAAGEGSQDQAPLSIGDRWLLSLPLYHIGGLAILWRCLTCGATAVLPDSEALADNLVQQKITHLSLVATQLKRLLEQQPQSLNGLKTLLLGGGPIPQSLLDGLKPYSLNALTSYGMTEMGSQICTGPANSQGLSGFPLAGRQIRINKGLIEVNGDSRFIGYYQQGRLTTPFDQDGWFATRDLGQFIGEQIKVIGRADNMFISGGENVQPETIEAVLKRCEGVEEVIVVPVDDAEFGQLPVAVVKGDWQAAALEKRVMKKLPRFMRPRRYLSWPAHLSTGELKISRATISNWLAKS
ncbi:o-succinylbenzoate--CoA ligase [Ferrimonas pelagia]|uniref:O-succinylbenzoate--CoA ligase n=1 Tax=Ferrimonas pelagia TaxID=1177826 RepID=A0ABP9ESG3_9GAMM